MYGGYIPCPFCLLMLCVNIHLVGSSDHIALLPYTHAHTHTHTHTNTHPIGACHGGNTCLSKSPLLLTLCHAHDLACHTKIEKLSPSLWYTCRLVCSFETTVFFSDT